MGSEMQEKIAKAIEEASKDCDDPAVYYQVVALAAIEAMREPTEVMVDAADDPFHVAWRESNEFADRHGLARGHASVQFSKPMYRAMLDAEIEAAKKGL